MNLYPNYYSLNNFFINNFNDNFNDYEKFVDNLKLLNFNDTIRVFDKIAGKYTDLNDNYNSRIFLKFENFIVDSYLNIFIISENQLNIQNYVEFPPYILFLIKDKITDRPTINDIEYAKALLKLTKYIIIHNNHNHNNNDEDIEDSIYLKNQIIQYKSELNEKEYILLKKEGKIDELNNNIIELKLKLRKANFSLMENQNIFSELHIDMCEKDQEIEKQKLEIEKQKLEIEKQKLEIEKQKIEIDKHQQNIENYESTYIYKLYSIYEGLYIYFSRFRLF